MGRQRPRTATPAARRGRESGGPSDEIDWNERLDRRGVGWYCGFIFPVGDFVRGMDIDDLAALPRCDRWHQTQEAREACDHGLPTEMDPAVVFGDGPRTFIETPPVSPVPIETTGRVNRFDGSCLWCGGTVRAGAGQLVDIDGCFMPVHNQGDC